jgi:hypothetical protein
LRASAAHGAAATNTRTGAAGTPARRSTATAAPTSTAASTAAATLGKDDGGAGGQRSRGNDGNNGAFLSFRHWSIPGVDVVRYANVTGSAAFHDGPWPTVSFDGYRASTHRYN